MVKLMLSFMEYVTVWTGKPVSKTVMLVLEWELANVLNILGVLGHTVSVTAELCCGVKAALDNPHTNQCGCVPYNSGGQFPGPLGKGVKAVSPSSLQFPTDLHSPCSS